MPLLENIKKICSEKGITVSELEKRAGLAENSIYKWKHVEPGYMKVTAVAVILETPFEDLVK